MFTQNRNKPFDSYAEAKEIMRDYMEMIDTCLLCNEQYSDYENEDAIAEILIYLLQEIDVELKLVFAESCSDLNKWVRNMRQGDHLRFIVRNTDDRTIHFCSVDAYYHGDEATLLFVDSIDSKASRQLFLESLAIRCKKIFISTDSQVSSADCLVFALAQVKNMKKYKNEILSIHKNIKNEIYSSTVIGIDAIHILPPQFFKHTQSQKKLITYT